MLHLQLSHQKTFHATFSSNLAPHETGGPYNTPLFKIGHIIENWRWNRKVTISQKPLKLTLCIQFYYSRTVWLIVGDRAALWFSSPRYKSRSAQFIVRYAWQRATARRSHRRTGVITFLELFLGLLARLRLLHATVTSISLTSVQLRLETWK